MAERPPQILRIKAIQKNILFFNQDHEKYLKFEEKI